MQSPTQQQGSRLLIRLGVYTQSRVGIDPRTRPLLVLLTAKTDDLRIKLRAREDADEQVIITEAGADASDEGFDSAFMAFADAVKNAAGRNYNSPLYKKILPHGTVRYTQPRLFDQVTAGGDLFRHLDLPEVKQEPIVQEHRPKLEAKLDELKKSLNPYQQSVERVAVLRGAEYLSRAAFIRTYTATFGGVLAAVGTKQEAERFFRRFRAEPDADEDQEPEAGDDPKTK